MSTFKFNRLSPTTTFPEGSKIAEWDRFVDYESLSETISLKSIIYSTDDPDAFALKVVNYTNTKATLLHKPECILFKYEDLLLCNNLESNRYLEIVILFDHDTKFILNLYLKYVCIKIEEYRLKLPTYKSPLILLFEHYLPTELARIIQTYILANDFVAKDISIFPGELTENYDCLSGSYKI